MSDTPWTPGPWVAGNDKVDGGFDALRIATVSGDVTVIGGCGCCGSPYGDNPADVSLIAAAPDMAETLIWLRANLRDATTSEIEHLLDAIIAKARGQA